MLLAPALDFNHHRFSSKERKPHKDMNKKTKDWFAATDTIPNDIKKDESIKFTWAGAKFELKPGQILHIKKLDQGSSMTSKVPQNDMFYQVTMLDNGRIRCDICSKDFSAVKNAYQHQKSIHFGSKIKTFLCKSPGCQKKFPSLRYLKEHARNMHGISAKMIPSTSKTKATKSVKRVIAREPQNIDVKEEPVED